MLAACCSTAEHFILLGVPLLKVSWPLHCAPQHTGSHTTPEAAHLPQFPKSGSTSFPPPCLVLTLNHEPQCKVAVTVAVPAGPTGHSPTRGRGSWPSRLCWRARRRWGRKPGSRNPARGCWRGCVLSSSRLLYTPHSSRRSLCSLSRPGTRTCSCLRSPARTGSCPWASWAEGCEPCWKMSTSVWVDRESALWFANCNLNQTAEPSFDILNAFSAVIYQLLECQAN